MKKKNARKAEIKKILCGFIEYDGDAIRAANSVWRLSFNGFFSGFAAAGLLGLSEIQRQYRITSPKPEDDEALKRAFASLGRQVRLDSSPDVQAVMCSPVLFNPSVMTLETKGKNHLICFYTARSLTSRRNFSRMLAELEKKLSPVRLNEVRVTVKTHITDVPAKEKRRKRAASQKRV